MSDFNSAIRAAFEHLGLAPDHINPSDFDQEYLCSLVSTPTASTIPRHPGWESLFNVVNASPATVQEPSATVATEQANPLYGTW